MTADDEEVPIRSGANDRRGFDYSGFKASRPHVATRPGPLGCSGCRRPIGQTHDTWCPVGGGEDLRYQERPLTYQSGPVTVPVPKVAERIDLGVTASTPVPVSDPTPYQSGFNGRDPRSRQAQADKRKEAKAVILADIAANLHMPAPSTEATPDKYPCSECGPQLATLFTMKIRGGPYAICNPCKSAKLQAARDTAKAAKPATDQARYSVAEAVADLGIDPVEPVDDLVLINFDEPPISEPNGPGSTPSSVDLAPSSVGSSAANLRAERARVVEYLAQLDQDIEQADAVEQLGALTPEQLQGMLAEAQRTARLCELALGKVA